MKLIERIKGWFRKPEEECVRLNSENICEFMRKKFEAMKDMPNVDVKSFGQFVPFAETQEDRDVGHGLGRIKALEAKLVAPYLEALDEWNESYRQGVGNPAPSPSYVERCEAMIEARQEAVR